MRGTMWRQSTPVPTPSSDAVERLCCLAREQPGKLNNSELALMASTIERLSAERLQLREALEPSGDTKAAYSGEFSIDVPLDGYGEDGEPLEGSKRVLVPWTTIKEIMAAISDRAALQVEIEPEGRSGLLAP